jgi:hypothetical protein
VSSRSPGGLLVMVVDAADDSVIAASTGCPHETSFVFQFLDAAKADDLKPGLWLGDTARKEGVR